VPSAPALVFDPDREEAELRGFLGDKFDRARLERYQQTLDDEVAEIDDEHTLYRTSQAYLYNLTAFAMSPTKRPYIERLVATIPRGSRVLDYGCGIGSDGLTLLEAGYDVEFADFDNPSTAYLRWRLEHRGLEAPIHDLEGQVPGGFDAAFAFDVIEHVDDPFSFLGEMERRARYVEVNFLAPEPDDQDLHHDLPIKRLVRHAARHELVHYRVYHGRSHLVLYRSEPAGPIKSVGGLARLAIGRLRAAAG
jgi:SAM-dependent methyltransferase